MKNEEGALKNPYPTEYDDIPPVTLYDYQEDALRRMHDGCILYAKVGRGKSRTALAYYYEQYGGRVNTASYVFMKEPPDLVIITTARKRDTFEWEKELVPFHMSTHPELSLYSHKVIVDGWNNIRKYTNRTGCFFIFDEQRVVGSGSWVKSFWQIAKENRWILLSATPGDTWTDYVPVFVANGFFRNRSEFNREHVIFAPFRNFPKVDHYLGTGRLIRLRERILVDMGGSNAAVTHHEDLWCEYDREKYKTIGRTRWDPYKNEPIQNASGICYVWRRIVNEDISRQMKLMEIFEDHPKLIVFYNFDYELDILRTLFESVGVEYGEWNGHKHQPIPEGTTWAYLVQYRAGCEGWNCVRTDTTVFYSQNYSYKVMIQAAGRTDRVNSPYSDLYYYHLKSKSGIDLAIARSLAGKKDFNEGRFAGKLFPQ